MRMFLIAFSLLFPVTAYAKNSACWRSEPQESMSCVQLNESLFLSLRGQTMEHVRKVMQVPGRNVEHGLRFLSNYGGNTKMGSGSINVTFESGQAVIVSAKIDKPNSTGRFDFLWNAYKAPHLGEEIDRSTKDFARMPFCSDLSIKSTKCTQSNDIDYLLTISQMSFNTTKHQLFVELKEVCRISEDKNDDCSRLQKLLQ